MAFHLETPGLPGVERKHFTATHWSVVLDACQQVRSSAAIENLCRTYWYPLYAYVRRRGYPPHDAQDMTQEFFARLVQPGFLKGVHPEKGKFRSFLLASMEHLLANQWRQANAQKRGGGIPQLPLDEIQAEEQYLACNPTLSPQQIFDHESAVALLDKVLKVLRDEFVSQGKGELFERIKVFLTGERSGAPYSVLSAEFGTTEAALKMAISRLRKRYGELLLQELGGTVSNQEEAMEELRFFLAALSL